MTTLPRIFATAEMSDSAGRVFNGLCRQINIRCDRMFAALFVVQWILGICAAVVITPRTWIGTTSYVHLHVWLAIFLGAAIISFPLHLIFSNPGKPLTRQAVAAAQMLFSAMLIHLTGGRIETHFHIFGSLALLAFYRDWKVVVTATVVVAADHFLRGVFWSQSVFGNQFASPWRWLEHAGWVVFEDVFLVMACFQARAEMAEIARRQADTQMAADSARAEQQDLLDTLNAGTIVGIADGNGIITYVNDRYCQVSGYTREELVGKSIKTFKTESAATGACADLIETVTKGGLWVGELCRRSKDGRLLWFQAASKGLLDENGRHRRTVSVQHDITDRKSAEMHAQQAQRLESIGQLAAGIAHEINTPAQYVGDNVRFLQTEFKNLVRAMDVYSEELDQSRPASSWSDRADRIRATLEKLDFDFLRDEIPKAISQSLEGMDRVSAIVRAMKDFSHPGSEVKESADLNRSIESTIEVCRSRWKYSADLHLDLEPALPPVPCLIAEINQVVLNLVVNAADAIAGNAGPNADTKGNITVSTRVVNGLAEIRVRDDGPGIPEAIRGRVFEQFFTTKPVGKGTGQGLALCRGIVTAKHGGELFFESPPEGGTVFVVRLPLVDSAMQQKAAA